MNSKTKRRPFLVGTLLFGGLLGLGRVSCGDPLPKMPIASLGGPARDNPPLPADATYPLDRGEQPGASPAVVDVLRKATWLHGALRDDQTETSMKRVAQTLSEADLRAVTDQALDESLSMEARWSALTLLTMADRRQAIPYLSRILRAPIGADPDRRDAEASLRISATEALDEWPEQNPQIAETFREVAIKTPDRTLQTAVLIALRGADQHRPGKLKRFMDSWLDGEPRW